jgi:hypothetical protein
MLREITRSPYLNLLSGAILLATSGYETWSTFGAFSIGSHHGILLFSIIHILKTIPEITHGLKNLEEGQEELGSKESLPDSE